MRFTPDPVSDETRSEVNMILKRQFQKDFAARAYFTGDEFREWAKDQHRNAESIALFYNFLEAMGYVVRGRDKMIRHCCVSVHPERSALDVNSIGNLPSVGSSAPLGKALASFTGMGVNRSGWRV